MMTHSTPMLGIAFVLAFSATSADLCSAQNKPIPPTPAKHSIHDSDNTETTLLGMQAVMNLRVDTIQQVIDLEPDATEQLRAAAMTAVTDTYKKAKKDLPRSQMQSAPAPTEKSKDDKVDETGKRKGKYGKLNVTAVLDEPAWKTAFQEILTDNQRSQLKAYWDGRIRFSLEVATKAYVAKLEKHLNLSPNQRELIADLMRKAIAAEQKRGVSVREYYGTAIRLYEGKSRRILVLKPTELESLLSKAQWAENHRRSQGHPSISRRNKDAPAASAPPIPPIGNSWINVKFEFGAEVEQTTEGVVVKSISDRSIAHRLGVQVNDVLHSVDHQPIENSIQLGQFLKKIPANQGFKIEVIRGGNTVALNLPTETIAEVEPPSPLPLATPPSDNKLGPMRPANSLGLDRDETTLKGMQALMRVYIDTIYRITGFDQATDKKLAIAGTIAVRTTLANAEELTSTTIIHSTRTKDKKGPPPLTLSDEDAETGDDERPKNGNVRIRETKYRKANLAAFLKQPIWQKTVQNTLTRDQQLEMTEYWVQREAFVLNAAKQRHVLEIDRYVNLLPEQRDAILATIDKRLADFRQKGNKVVASGNSIYVMLPRGKAKLMLSPEDVTPIFWETQLSEFLRWTSRYRRHQPAPKPAAANAPKPAAVETPKPAATDAPKPAADAPQ